MTLFYSHCYRKEDASMKPFYQMTTLLFVLALISTRAHAGDAQSEQAFDTMRVTVQKLQGTWESVSVYRDGKRNIEQTGVRVAVRGRDIKVTEGDYVELKGH
jgi:hypothetical protein